MSALADEIATVAAEIASGQRCAICTDPIEDGSPVTPLGDTEAIHDACVEELENGCMP